MNGYTLPEWVSQVSPIKQPPSTITPGKAALAVGLTFGIWGLAAFGLWKLIDR
jgi:choline-glycine betaine transporter